MIDRFTSRAIRKTPDQTTYGLNQLASELKAVQSSLRIVSEDGSAIIVIGNQPMDPATKKPYGFGIKKYRKKGDNLELIGDVSWQ